MKTALKILLVVNFSFFLVAIAMKMFSMPRYEVPIGLGMLFLTFVLMPFFLFYRYDAKRQAKKNQNNK